MRRNAIPARDRASRRCRGRDRPFLPARRRRNRPPKPARHPRHL